VEINIRDIERDTSVHLDDLDTALFLMSMMGKLFSRLEDKQQTMLLRILAKRIIVNPQGKIIDQELYAPFTYLKSIADNYQNSNQNGSSWVQYRPQDHKIRYLLPR
jgi:hypothetical protein